MKVFLHKRIFFRIPLILGAALLLCLLLTVGAAAVDHEPFSAEDLAAVTAAVDSYDAAAGEPAELACGAAILLDAASGTVLYELSADQPMYPASMTKLMTMVLVLEAIDAGKADPTDSVTVSAEAASLGGSQVYLYEGEVMTLGDLMLAVAVGSANDAAVAVGEYIAGSNESFVARMNEKAQELGMTSTHYVNAHGLHDEQHYTTARDMAKLCLYAQNVPGLLALTSTKEASLREGQSEGAMALYNTNKLLFWYDGTDGFKTGTTTPAGRCLAATAKRDGLRLISVVMGGNVKNAHYSESMKLLNYGFANYEMVSVAVAGDKLAQTLVPNGLEWTAWLTAAEDLSLLSKRGQEPQYEIRIETEEEILAPYEADTVWGHATLLADGEAMDECDLVAAEPMAKMHWYQALGRFFMELVNITPELEAAPQAS